MKKVFYEGKGFYRNYVKAAVASLFEKNVDHYPTIFTIDDLYKKHDKDLYIFDAHLNYPNIKNKIEFTKRVLEQDKGIKGCFLATLKNSEPVIIDMDMNVLHDPNPDGKNLLKGPEDIDVVCLTSKNIQKKIFEIEKNIIFGK